MIVCTKENLLRALLSVERAVGKNSTLPVLSHVALIPSTGRLRIQATDLDLAIIATMPAKVEIREPFTLPMKTFLGFVAALPDETIHIKKEKNNLFVTAGSFRGKLHTGTFTDFPIIPLFPQTNSLKLNGKNFSQALRDVLTASAHTETRPELNGVYVHSEERWLRVVATDTFRLALRALSFAPGDALSIILPTRSAQEASRLFQDDPEIECWTNEAQCTLCSPRVTLTSRLVEGAFPDYRAILPGQAAASFDVARAELIQKLEAATVFAGRFNDIALTFRPHDASLALRAAHQDVGSYETTVSGTNASGEAQDLSVNLRYFLDGVRGIADETCRIELNGEKKPIVLRSASAETEALYLIMPIRQS